ncbi:recombinase family protein [Rickettsiales bacterium]|nr:recombinase family protein [Rickettsiales bacterium]
MKAIILTRVSTDDQQDWHSIDAQKVILKQYCNKKSLKIIIELLGWQDDVIASLD